MKNGPIQFLVLTFLCLAELAAQAPCDSSFRVLSFNIRYNNPDDSSNAWPNRKDRVAGLIRFHGADLCGFQEALEGQIDDLAALLPGFGWYGVGRDDGKEAGEFSPIFYRTSRFRLISAGTFWLSPTPGESGSKGWDAALPRIVTSAVLEDLSTHMQFRMFNTHFDHVGETARRMSARVLLDSVRAANFPVIVTGDFNSSDTSVVYRTMTGDSILSDAVRISRTPHYGPMTTWNGFKEIEEGKRIDFVFVGNDIDVLSHAILTDRWDGRFPSDHLPVIACLVLN